MTGPATLTTTQQRVVGAPAVAGKRRRGSSASCRKHASRDFRTGTPSSRHPAPGPAPWLLGSRRAATDRRDEWARFLTRDPLVAQTMEPYSYAANDPINMVDPNGLAPSHHEEATEACKEIRKRRPSYQCRISTTYGYGQAGLDYGTGSPKEPRYDPPNREGGPDPESEERDIGSSSIGLSVLQAAVESCVNRFLFGGVGATGLLTGPLAVFFAAPVPSQGAWEGSRTSSANPMFRYVSGIPLE